MTVAVLAGAAILFPSLALLFRLVLGGDLGPGEGAPGRPAQAPSLLAALAPRLVPRLAIACLVAGIGFLTVADAAWAHTLGVFCLFAFIVTAFPAALPPDLMSASKNNRSPGATDTEEPKADDAELDEAESGLVRVPIRIGRSSRPWSGKPHVGARQAARELRAWLGLVSARLRPLDPRSAKRSEAAGDPRTPERGDRRGRTPTKWRVTCV